jgi:oligopeptide/dipeptide ABC transporter ATP-binding protein
LSLETLNGQGPDEVEAPPRSRDVSADPTRAIAPTEAPLLEVQDLRTYFYTRRGVGRAVDGVSFALRARETLGLVGESGSGKSMTAMSILQLHPRPASRIIGGRVILNGEDLLGMPSRRVRSRLGRHVAYVPQDPLSSLDPVLTIGEQVSEPLRIHLRMAKRAASERAVDLLRRVYVPLPRKRLQAFPHQLSGGMRQRVVSAAAISCDPEVLIADEPTTSLDVTVQADYLDLLREIKAERRFGIVFITHDFGIVANICDRVAVMYGGQIVETAPTRRLFFQPAHPYTSALLRSLPDVERRAERLPAIGGQPPSIFNLPAGCRFEPRCDFRRPICRERNPDLVPQPGAADHSGRCWGTQDTPEGGWLLGTDWHTLPSLPIVDGPSSGVERANGS